MRITEKMIDNQLAIINDKLKNNNKKVVCYNTCGYKTIGLIINEYGGQITIRSGLTTREAYDCLYTYNELTYQLKKC